MINLHESMGPGRDQTRDPRGMGGMGWVYRNGTVVNWVCAKRGLLTSVLCTGNGAIVHGWVYRNGGCCVWSQCFGRSDCCAWYVCTGNGAVVRGVSVWEDRSVVHGVCVQETVLLCIGLVCRKRGCCASDGYTGIRACYDGVDKEFLPPTFPNPLDGVSANFTFMILRWSSLKVAKRFPFHVEFLLP